MSEPTVGWPLPPAQGEILATLAGLIRRGGAARFLAVRVAAANTRDFPVVWEPTLDAVHRLLYRVAWHAHFDIEITVRDVRPALPPDNRMLKKSELELLAVEPGKASFDVAALGNDDVAGRAAHAIGDAFLALAPIDPFREAGREATAAEASITAVYLGLGVLVANSSMYRRNASRVVGRSVVSEDFVEQSGGLSIADATLLVAIQDAVRDDHSPALDTLLAPQKEWLERWRTVLEPHEAELRALLGLDDAPAGPPLTRADTPRAPAAVAEPDLKRFNRGRKTFRVPQRTVTRGALGFFAGSLGFLVPIPAVNLVLGPVAMLAGAIAGYVYAARFFACSDPDCRRHMATEVETCPGCGGAILETIANANLRLERLEALEGPPPDPDPDDGDSVADAS